MKVEVDIELTPAVIAGAFCDLDDEQQAQVFIEIARIAAATWKGGLYGMQLWLVGRHLRDCECSSPEARDVVLEIASGITTTTSPTSGDATVQPLGEGPGTGDQP